MLHYMFPIWIKPVQGHCDDTGHRKFPKLDPYRSGAVTKRSALRQVSFAFLSLSGLILGGVVQPSNLAFAQFSATVSSADVAMDTLYLDDALDLAKHQNPELIVARKRLDIARAAIWSARARSNPNLILEGEPGFSRDEYSYSIGIEQSIPLFGKVGKRVSLAESEFERDSADVEDTQRLLLGAVRSVYRTAQNFAQRVLVAEEDLALGERLAAIARIRFSKGEVSELDVRQFEIESYRRRQELINLSSQRATALVALSRLLDAPFRDELRLQKASGVRRDSLPLDTFLRVAQSRSSVRSHQFEKKAAERQLKLERAERWDDPSLSLSLSKEKTSFAEVGGPLLSENFLRAELRIPVPLFYGRKGETAQAIARSEVAHASMAAERVNVDREVRDAHLRMSATLMTVDGYGDGIRTAEQAQQLGEQAYSRGLVGVVQLIQVQRQLLEVKVSRLDALNAYHQALSDLESAVGMSIDEVFSNNVGTVEGE